MSGPLFFVYPSQFLDFKEVSTPESGASKLFTRIEIENLAEQRIAYRVRTNSKDSYSVHHNPGFVERGRRGEVLVYLKPGQTLSAQHRFMVTAAEVPEESASQDRHDFWKQPRKGKLAHWRLSVRPAVMDAELTMSMYQQQVQALKLETQMLRNKCEELAQLAKAAGPGGRAQKLRDEQELDEKTVFLLAAAAVFVTQLASFVVRYLLE